MVKRKIEAMYERFGRVEGKRCSDCQNFASGRYHDKTLQKCAFYGLTHSEATDWRKKWDACGRFYDNADESGETPVIEILKHAPKGKESAVCDGQLTLFDEQSED